MDFRTEADRIVANAERDLRRLIAAAAEAGRYEAIGYLAAAASRLSSTAGPLPDSTGEEQPDAKEDQREMPGDREAPDSQGLSEQAVSPQVAVRARRKYPMFYREGERLVKVGWSKSQHSEYEHKAGKAVLTRVVSALHEISQRKRRFDLEALGQLTLDGKDSAIPAYQVYLCAAWLRALGLLIQNGRKGYALANRGQLKEQIEREWEKLEVH